MSPKRGVVRQWLQRAENANRLRYLPSAASNVAEREAEQDDKRRPAGLYYPAHLSLMAQCIDITAPDDGPHTSTRVATT